MPSLAFTHARIAETTAELQRLRDEIREWHGARVKADRLQQYATPLRLLNEIFEKATADIAAQVSTIDPKTPERAFEDCRRLDRANVWIRRVWNYFRRRFDQRDGATHIAAVLKAADEVVWSCYADPFREIGRKDIVAPLPYIEDRLTAHAIPREDLPPDLAAEVDAQFLRRYLSALPIAVIALPPSCIEHPWNLIQCAHEAGHHVQYDLISTPPWGLVGAFGNLIATAAGAETPPSKRESTMGRWRNWGREIFADTFAAFTVGPAAVVSLAGLLYSDPHTLLETKPLYPQPIVRLALMSELLTPAGTARHPVVTEIDALIATVQQATADDPHAAGLATAAKQDLSLVPAVAKVIRCEKLLSTRTLPEITGWNPTTFGNKGPIDYWADTLRKPGPYFPDKDLRCARLVLAGAALAWKKVCNEASQLANPEAIDESLKLQRLQLRSATLAAVLDSREEGTRRAPTRTPINTQDLGSELASLVLSAPG